MSFLAAVQFLTAIPLSLLRNRVASASELRRSLAFFPLVGALLGLTLVGVDKAFAEIFPRVAASALVLVVWVVLTGALHMDGLMDTFDGLFGGRTPERRLEIMKDPHIGSFGVTAAIGILLLKWSALISLNSPVRLGALVLAVTVSRWTMVLAINRFRYLRAEGVGRVFADGLTRVETVVAAASAFAISGVFLGWAGVGLAAGGTLAALGMAFYIRSKIGGMVGDSYGAINEIVETAMLLGTIALYQKDWIHALVWSG